MVCSIMTIYKKTFFLAVMLIRLSLGKGENIVAPKDTEAATGANVTLYCKSTIDQIEWHHFPVGESIHEIVYQDGFIFNGYSARFNVNQKDSGEYNLVIRDVKTNDAGKYTCVEKSEVVLQKTAELIVFEQYPSVKYCTAKFTCALVCDVLELSCGLKAHGNIVPSMEWRESANGILTSSFNNDNGMKTSSIHLEPSSTTAQSYSCRVKYPTNSSLTTQFSWSYSISVPSSQMSLSSDEKLLVQSNTTGFIVLIAILVAALVVNTAATVILFYKNKRNKAKFVNSMKPTSPTRSTESASFVDVENGSPMEQKPLLMQDDADEDEESITGICVPRTAPNSNNSIHGIGVLDDEIFLVTRDGCVIEVFGLKTAKFKRSWVIEGLVNPNDMATCSRRNLVFICDWKKAGESREIFCCDKNGKLDCRWISETERGQISITNETNVIVAENYFNTIREYTYFGRLINKFDTGRQKLHLWHAVKLESGIFVAGFGDTHDEIQEICIIDSLGNTIRSIDQKSNLQQYGIRLSVPRCLAVDKEGTIYVSDLYNRRIILLTPELQYKGKIDEGKNEEKLRGPLRICISESDQKRQLVVADSVKKDGKWIDGRIHVLNPIPSEEQHQLSTLPF